MTESKPAHADGEAVKLSVVIIAKNEEINLRRCLESVQFADEIVVVDQFSTDRTVEICEEYKCAVYQREMTDGFGPQKQFGVEKATHNWILSIDADEWLPDELSAAVQAALSNGRPEFDGYEVMRRTSYLGHWVKHCGWYVPILRLFNRERGGFNNSKVHEMLIVDGRIGRLEGDLLHQSYRSITQHINKLNLFTDFDAEIIDARGIVLKPSNFWWYFAAKPFILFLRKFILMKGYKDGVSGFVISLFTGLSSMIMHMKAWHLQHMRSRRDMVSSDLTNT